MGAGTAVTVTGIVTWIKMENTLVNAGFASCHFVITSSCHHVTVGPVGAGSIVTRSSLADGGDSPSVTVVTMSQIW